MGSKNLLFYSATLVFGSIMLLTTTSNGVSNTFEVHAANNCDATSTCLDIGFGQPDLNTHESNCRVATVCVNAVISGDFNTQRNNCNDNAVCSNVAIGNLNNQNNNCNLSNCENIASSNLPLNIQNNNCNRDSRCSNNAFGESGTQNIACTNGSECNTIGISNAQNVACANGSVCSTIGVSTQDTVCQASTCTNLDNNLGVNTRVLSNSATAPCESSGPDTTTLCQRDRTFVFPNH